MNLDVIYDLIKPGVTVAHFAVDATEDYPAVKCKFTVNVVTSGASYIRLTPDNATAVSCDIGDDPPGHKCLLLTEGDVVIWRAS